MSTYLFHGFQTPETLAKLLAAPEDRAAVIAPLFKSLGGELLGYWYVLGGVEVYIMFELPDDVAATGMAARVASSGAFASPTCTRLMTVQETLAALGGAGSTRITAHRGSLSNLESAELALPLPLHGSVPELDNLPNALQWWELLRSRPVLARKPSNRPGRYCIRRSRVLTSAVS